MRILYLKTDIHFETLIIGGSISHMLGMLQGFKANHHTVIIASSVDHEQLNELCFKKYILRMPRILKYMRWKINCILSSFFFLPLTLYLMYKYQPDYIYQRYSPFNFTGIFIQYLTNIPLILEYNGSEVWADKAWLKHSYRQYFLKEFMAWCEHKILLYAAYQSVVSPVLKDELIQRYALQDTVRLTPNGVNTALFNPSVMTRIIPFPSTSFVIGFSSTFGPWHGVEIIEYLITQFAHHKLDIHMLLLGTGPLYEHLLSATSHAQDYVTPLGRVPHAHMPSYLAACDAFICPTQPNNDGTPFFGSPTKLFEYASLAKPIIISHIAQINAVLPELFHIDQVNLDAPLKITQQAGVCVEPTDKQGFLNACLLLKNLSAQQRSLMGNNARSHMIQHYEWSSIVRSLLDSLED